MVQRGRRISKVGRPGRAGRPTAVELERRKKRVIDLATELFIHNGYAATSLVDIAKRAGVATRTIYEHFGDKEQLFHDVVFSPDNAPSVQIPRVVESESLYDALLRVGRYALDVSLNAKTANMMRLMIAEHNRFPDVLKKLANASFSHFRSTVEQIFIDLQLLGRIPAGDHQESARFFIDLVLGATPFYNYTQWIELPPTDSDLVAKIDLFIAGRFGPKIAKGARLATRMRATRKTTQVSVTAEAGRSEETSSFV